MTGALLELVRAPAALSVPGDTMAGAAAAGRRPARRPGPGVGAACTGREWRSTTGPTVRLDAVERPERPIPSGRVRPGAALGLAAGLTAAGLATAAPGRRPARSRRRRPAGRRGLGLRPGPQADGGGTGGDGGLPRAGRAARRRRAGRGRRAGGAGDRRAHLRDHRPVPGRGDGRGTRDGRARALASTVAAGLAAASCVRTEPPPGPEPASLIAG